MIDPLVYDGNITHRIAGIKHFFNVQQEPEVILDQWLRKFCNIWLEEEFLAQRGCNWYERKDAPCDYGNGYYLRRLVTARGRVELIVPRGRWGTYKYTLFEKYRRYSSKFEDIVVDSLLLGHSTRDARRFFNDTFGPGTLSHAFASKTLRRFDSEIGSWKSRPILKKVKVLVLDAVHLKGAITGHKRAKPVLCAWCIYADGTEELIDFEPMRSESSEAWGRFCGKLYQRGLTDVELAVRDDCPAIAEAISTYWPKAMQQLCVFHLMQNFAKKLKGLTDKRSIIKDAEKIFEAKNKTSMYGALNKFMSKWGRYKYHPALRYLYENIEVATQFYDIDEEFQAAAKTSNRLERSFKEVKRRVKAFGRFPNTRSCCRWLFALIKEGLLPRYERIIPKGSK